MEAADRLLARWNRGTMSYPCRHLTRVRYELRVPIGDIGGRAAGQPPSQRRKITVVIQIGGLTDAERELIGGFLRSSTRGPGGAPPSGGTGGRGGVGGIGGPGGGGPPGGGRPGGGPGGTKKCLDPEVNWLEVILEAQPDDLVA